MPNQGPWTAGLKGTSDQLNSAYLQSGTKASRPASNSTNTGMEWYATDTQERLRSNGTGAGGDLGDGWDIVTKLDAAAGIGSLRTLGSGATQGAAGTHTHTPSLVGGSETDLTEQSATSTGMVPTTISTTEVTVKTQVRMAGAANRAFVVSFGLWQHCAASTAYGAWELRLYKVVSGTPTLLATLALPSQNIPTLTAIQYSETHFEADPPNGTSVDFQLRAIRTSSPDIIVVAPWLHVVEVKV